MASSEDLKDVLKDTLENRGVLGQIKARIRAEVFNALDDQTEAKPALSNENVLINELVREYLEFNKYKYSSSVLTAESGMPKIPLKREFLRNELNVVEDGPAKPLLYSIVSHYVNGHHSGADPSHNAQWNDETKGGNRAAFHQMEADLDDGEAGVGLMVRGQRR